MSIKSKIKIGFIGNTAYAHVIEKNGSAPAKVSVEKNLKNLDDALTFVSEKYEFETNLTKDEFLYNEGTNIYEKDLLIWSNTWKMLSVKPLQLFTIRSGQDGATDTGKRFQAITWFGCLNPNDYDACTLQFSQITDRRGLHTTMKNYSSALYWARKSNKMSVRKEISDMRNDGLKQRATTWSKKDKTKKQTRRDAKKDIKKYESWYW